MKKKRNWKQWRKNSKHYKIYKKSQQRKLKRQEAYKNAYIVFKTFNPESFVDFAKRNIKEKKITYKRRLMYYQKSLNNGFKDNINYSASFKNSNVTNNSLASRYSYIFKRNRQRRLSKEYLKFKANFFYSTYFLTYYNSLKKKLNKKLHFVILKNKKKCTKSYLKDNLNSSSYKSKFKINKLSTNSVLNRKWFRLSYIYKINKKQNIEKPKSYYRNLNIIKKVSIILHKRRLLLLHERIKVLRTPKKITIKISKPKPKKSYNEVFRNGKWSKEKLNLPKDSRVNKKFSYRLAHQTKYSNAVTLNNYIFRKQRKYVIRKIKGKFAPKWFLKKIKKRRRFFFYFIQLSYTLNNKLTSYFNKNGFKNYNRLCELRCLGKYNNSPLIKRYDDFSKHKALRFKLSFYKNQKYIRNSLTHNHKYPFLLQKMWAYKKHYQLSFKTLPTKGFFSTRLQKDARFFTRVFWRKYDNNRSNAVKKGHNIVLNSLYSRNSFVEASKQRREGMQIVNDAAIRSSHDQNRFKPYYLLDELGRIKWKWYPRKPKGKKRRKKYRYLHALTNKQNFLPKTDSFLTTDKFNNNVSILKKNTNILLSFSERQNKKKFIVQHNKTIYKRAFRFFYGNLRYKVFNKFYLKTGKKKYVHKIRGFFELFERLLFVVVYRMGFAPTMSLSKYLIKQGYISVNGKPITYTTLNVKNKDLISLSKEGQVLLFNHCFNKEHKVLYKTFLKKKYYDKYKQKNFIELYNRVPYHLLVNFRIYSGIYLTSPKLDINPNLFDYPVKYKYGNHPKQYAMLVYYMTKIYPFLNKKGF